MLLRADVGFLVLFFALVGSCWFGSFVMFHLGDNLVDILFADPNQYSWHMQRTFLFLVLPPLAVLILYLVAYILEMKSPTGILEGNVWILHVIFGIVFILWGINGIQWTRYSYPEEIDKSINFYHSTQTASYVSSIYAFIQFSFFLWIPAGMLLMTSPVLTMILRIRRKSRKQTHQETTSV